jgi:hypothetical protein
MPQTLARAGASWQHNPPDYRKKGGLLFARLVFDKHSLLLVVLVGFEFGCVVVLV